MAKNDITEGIVFEPRDSHKHSPDSAKLYDVIIIGFGVSGYSSAMYAARLGLKVLIIGETPGGTLALSGNVENYPGFVSIEGQKLSQLIENHALDYDIDVLYDIVEDIKKIGKVFEVITQNKAYKSKTIILATGASVKKLGVPGEKEFIGNGVSYCALCDVTHVKGKVAIVCGGGDSAIKEALLVASYAKKVYVLNNESKVHPEMANEKKLNSLLGNKIEVINNNQIVRIEGKKRMDKVILLNSFSGKKELFADGLFIYIGHNPKSNLAKNLGVKLNEKKEVIVNQRSETNIPGIFAAGDVTNNEWKQAIVGVAQAVTAAYYAYNYLNR